jgi:hypothetical protein
MKTLLFLIPGMGMLIIGIICLVFPHRMRQSISDFHKEQRFIAAITPFKNRVSKKSYIYELTILGIFAIMMSIGFLYVAMGILLGYLTMVGPR